MKDDYGTFVDSLLITVMISAGAVILITVIAGVSEAQCNIGWERKLVASGHAEYYLDKNNQRKWRMKDAAK